MDVHCSSCDEPWDVYHLRHDAIFETDLSHEEATAWRECSPTVRLSQRYREKFHAVGWQFGASIRVLSETSAKGVYYFNRTKKHGDWKHSVKPESEWGKVECEPIVEPILWEQVNQIIEEQLKSWKKPGKMPVNVFGNLAHCACGHKMYVRSDSPKYVCRACKNKIPIVDLDAIFHDELKGFFANRDRIAEHLQHASDNCSEKETLLAAHQKSIQNIRDEMTSTHRLYVDGGITAQGFSQFYKPAEDRLNQLTAELPKLQAEVDYLKINGLSAHAILAEAETLYGRWPSLASAQKRSIAESIVEKIVIGDGEIDITLSCLPSCEELTKTQQQLRGPGRGGPISSA